MRKLIFCVILALIYTPQVFPTELLLTSGRKISGEPQSLEANGIVWKGEKGNETFPLNQVQTISTGNLVKSSTDAGTVEVEMLDGSRLKVNSLKIVGKDIVLQGGLFGEKTKEVPISQLFAFFRESNNPKLMADFRSLVQKRGKRDILIIRKGESIDGLEGTLGEGTAAGDIVQFDIAGGASTPIRQTRVLGVILNQPPGSERVATLCRVFDIDGNQLLAQKVTILPDGIQVVAISGLTIEKLPWAKVSKLDFSSGALRYLSDLEPLQYETSSTEGFPEELARDTNLDRGEIRIAKQKYAKGLTIRSRSVVRYDIEGYRELQMIVGIVDELDADKQAKLTIEIDGKSVYSQVVKKSAGALPLTFGIQNGKQLKIIVESELLDLGSQISLAEARILK